MINEKITKTEKITLQQLTLKAIQKIKSQKSCSEKEAIHFVFKQIKIKHAGHLCGFKSTTFQKFYQNINYFKWKKSQENLNKNHKKLNS